VQADVALKLARAVGLGNRDSFPVRVHPPRASAHL
jgi:hypothetical protein